MIINHSYKLSAFGEFVNIQPTPENMILLLETFGEMKLLPSVYDELSTSNEEIKPIKRLALLSEDNKERFLIGTTRIDYEIIANEDTDLEKDKLDNYINRAKEIFSLISDKYKIKFSRLALNTENYLLQFAEGKVSNFINSYNVMEPKFYNGKEKNEFKVHLLTRIDENINGVAEGININTNISKSNFHSKEVENTEGLTVTVDINTLFENKNQRFSPVEMDDFVKSSFIIWDEIISDLGEKIECNGK